MTLIICKEPLCQTTAGCICERQLRSTRIVLDMQTDDLPALMRHEAKRCAANGFYSPAGSLLVAGAEEIDRLRKAAP
jgi:hypothetical protein